MSDRLHRRDGRAICDCLDSQFTGDHCKHSLATRLHSGDPLVVEALRQLVPAPGRSVRVA